MYLIIFRSMFPQLNYRRRTNRQMITPHIIIPRPFDKLPNLRTLQVLELILICGPKISDKTTMMTGDYDATLSCASVDGHVLGSDALFSGCGAELGGEIVFADAAYVDG